MRILISSILDIKYCLTLKKLNQIIPSCKALHSVLVNVIILIHVRGGKVLIEEDNRNNSWGGGGNMYRTMALLVRLLSSYLGRAKNSC